MRCRGVPARELRSLLTEVERPYPAFLRSSAISRTRRTYPGDLLNLTAISETSSPRRARLKMRRSTGVISAERPCALLSPTTNPQSIDICRPHAIRAKTAPAYSYWCPVPRLPQSRPDARVVGCARLRPQRSSPDQRLPSSPGNLHSGLFGCLHEKPQCLFQRGL